MLKDTTASSVILAVSLALAACGGSAEEAPVDATSETSAPVETAPATSEVAPSPAEPAETAATTEPASAEALSSEGTDIVEHLRGKTMQLWEVYNTHDADALEVFYEENYWKEQEEEIRSNMESFKSFGITIEAEELTPPTEVEPGRWATEHSGRFPMGSVHMVFIYEEFDGEWLLTYAEDH